MAINIRRNYVHQDKPGQILAKMHAVENHEDSPFILEIANYLISINVREDEQRWWSPEMTLRYEEETEGTRIYEVIGPNPSVFTLAMFFVILGSVGFIASIMWALSQMTVGDSSILAWFANFVSGLIIVTTFGVLALGRIKAADQVASLRKFFEEVIG